MRREKNGPHEPGARTMNLRMGGEEALNKGTVRHIITLLEDRRLVTSEGCAAVCGALVRLSGSRMGKVEALQRLGAAARDVLAQIPEAGAR